MRYARPSELTTIRLRKEFAGLTMTEKEVGEYLKRAKKLVSELKACGDVVKSVDIAYTVLMGLGTDYGALITTLTNMASKDNPLDMDRVEEAIISEELRMKLQKKVDINPLSFKHDTQSKSVETLAYAGRPEQHSYRSHPYQ